MNIRLLFIIAVLPAIVLLGFIYYRDRKEKQPIKLIILLLALGAGTIIPAAIAEGIGQAVLFRKYDSMDMTAGQLFFLCFFIIGTVEELGKYLVTVCATWKSKEFQHSYDGVIYAACASLGFAILENIIYVLLYGAGTGIVRAFTAIPLHCTVGVVMGALYAKAREAAHEQDTGSMIGFLIWAYVVPVCIHGLYDFAVMSVPYGFIGEGWVYVILIGAYLIAILLIFTCSKNDHRIDGRPEAADYGIYRKNFRRPGRSYYYQNSYPPYGQNYNNGSYPNNSGYSNNVGGYPNNSGYSNHAGGYPNNGGYPNHAGGYPNNSGYSNHAGGYPNNGGYPNGAGGYSNNNGYPNGVGSYSNNAGGYSNNSGYSDVAGGYPYNGGYSNHTGSYSNNTVYPNNMNNSNNTGNADWGNRYYGTPDVSGHAPYQNSPQNMGVNPYRNEKQDEENNPYKKNT